MEPASLGVLIPILVPISMFAMIFGIVYLHKRERMAMIERGMDPRVNKPKTYNNSYTLTFGLLLIGSGLGLFLAYILDNTIFTKVDDGSPAIYFSLIAIFGGAGLFLSHQMEKKEMNKHIDKELE